MPAISASVATEFCKLCGWAYESWRNRVELIDRNPRIVELKASWAADTLGRLGQINHEHALLQIAKLHDRAITGGKITLGLDYIVNYGGWSAQTQARLGVLRTRLDKFAEQLRKARNETLAHNDLAAVVSGGVLGEFAPSEDDAYFLDLQEFVNIVHDEVVGGPWQFNSLVKNDVEAFFACVTPRPVP
jgi:AbiU2